MASVVGLAAAAPLPSAGAAAWGFEQITPSEKGGGAVSNVLSGFVASPDGGALIHSSVLPYESLPVEAAPGQNRYLAVRGDRGWSNQALDVPYRLPPAGATDAQFLQTVLDVSPNFEYAVVASRLPLTVDADPSAAGGMYLRNTRTGALRLIFTTADDVTMRALLGAFGGLAVTYVGNDGSSVLFSINGAPLVAGAPQAVDAGALYSWTASGGLRYEAVVDGVMMPTGEIPGVRNDAPADSMPLGGGGLEHVYFQSMIVSQQGNAPGPVYVREGPNGARTTRLISYPRTGPQPAPGVRGAPVAVGAGGRYMLFQTDDDTPLLASDPPAAGAKRLYRFDAEADDPADELTYVGATAGSYPYVIQMAQDGKTLAFYSSVAQAGAPDDGANKLFVWREGHGTTYVYSADPGSRGGNGQAQVRRLSGDGRFLAFSDDSPSLAAQFGGFNNTSPGCLNLFNMAGPCDMVYRYDTETGDLDCASCRTDGAVPQGASGEPGRDRFGLIEMHRWKPRMVADDGTVFFTSRDALVTEDRNGRDDVYAWTKSDGNRLLSGASPGKRSRFVDATPDGSRVFLSSNDRLASTDQDDEDDVYATYAGAGVDDGGKPPVTAPCSGVDCRGSSDHPAPPPSVGTDQSDKKSDDKPARAKSTVRVLWARMRKGALDVRVRASTGGDLRVSGTTVKPAKRSVRDRGVYTLRVKLTRKSSQRLRQQKRLAVRLRATLSPPFGTSTKTSYRRTVRK